MAKNRTMQAKNEKLKRCMIMERKEADYIKMASGHDMAESATKAIEHKPTEYLTPDGNKRLRQQIVDSYRNIYEQILEYCRNGERVPRTLRYEYSEIMKRVNRYGLHEQISLV